MPNDEERLVVLLEARIKDLERNMAKAAGTTDTQFKRMRRSSKTATGQMEQDAIRSSTRINQAFAAVGTKIGGFGKAFAGGLVGTVAGLGVAGVIGSLQQVAGSVAAIGDEAKRAGVDVKAFQELKYVAEQNRIGVDALTDGIKEMNLRADEFILTGKGSASEAFQRLGFDAATLAKKLEDPSALFSEIIGKLGKFDKAAQIRIADEIFGGTGGEKFVQLIEQGEQGIRDTIRSANDLGIVMDKQLIERAAEVDRRFNEIANTVGSALKSAIVSAADSLAEFIDGFRDFENQRKGTLANRQRDIGLQRLDLENQRMQVPDSEAMTLRKIDEQLRLLSEEDARITSVLNDRVKSMERTATREWTPPKYTPPASGGSRKSSAAAAEREREAVKELIAELEEELRLVNVTDAERRRSEASRRAGAAATDIEREKIIGLTEAIYQEEEARRRVADQMAFYEDMTRGFIDDTIAGIEEGKNAFDSLADAAVNSLRRIGQSMVDDVLANLFKINGSGGGLFGNIFGGVFGRSVPQFDIASAGGLGLYAEGGISNRPAIFGEAGPEAAVPLPDGRRIPVDLGTSGGQTIHVSYAPVYQLESGSNAEIAAIKAQAERDRAEFASRTISVVRDAQKRRAL